MTRDQLRDAGVTRHEIGRMIAVGVLHPLHRGVYAVGHPAVGLDGREMAAVLACGPLAALSHQSAGGLWVIRPRWQGAVHVTAPTRRRVPGLIVHESRPEVVLRRGIPVTTPLRTLVDLADVLDDRALERALAQADARELVSAEDLAALPDLATGRRGAARLRRVYDLEGIALTRSELEERFLAFLAAHDLPRPLVNTRLHGYEVDFRWPEARLVVELDGWRYHRSQPAFEADRARDAALLTAGERVMRVTHRRLTRDARRLAAQLRGLTAREPARAPA